MIVCAHNGRIAYAIVDNKGHSICATTPRLIMQIPRSVPPPRPTFVTGTFNDSRQPVFVFVLSVFHCGGPEAGQQL